MQSNEIYIEVIPEKSNIGRNTISTSGIQSSVLKRAVLDDNLIKTIKENIDKICISLSENVVADELEIEFSFGVTGEGNICIFSGSSSVGIKVKMTWKK